MPAIAPTLSAEEDVGSLGGVGRGNEPVDDEDDTFFRGGWSGMYPEVGNA
jgi:hypothetical protein